MRMLSLGLILTGLACSGVAAHGQTSAPSAAAVPVTRLMEFRYENAPVDTILEDLSKRMGFVIQKTTAIPTRVSVMAPQPVNADEAITLLNTVLVTVGFSAIEQPEQENADGSTTRVLRVMPFADAKKAAPVGYGGSGPAE